MICPECGSKDLEHSQTEIICRHCGLVVEDNVIDTKPYVSEATKQSASIPQLAKAGGRKIDGRIYKASWLVSTKEKNLRHGMVLISDLAGKLRLPEYVVKDSKIIFKRAMDNDLAIGRDIASLSYASLYAACNIHNLPKTILELKYHTSLMRTRLMRAYKTVRRELSLDIPIIDPVDLIPRFASKLKLSQSTVTKAIELMTAIKDKGILSGKRPETVVATVLYIAAKMNNEPRTQRDVANAVGVIEVTIRKGAKAISRSLTQFIYK